MNTSSKVRKEQKIKNLGFFLRFFCLLIFITAIIVSVIFGTKYVQDNNKLSIEFAGGYETQVQYEGKSTQKDVIKLLKNRVDPLGTSNVNIENITSNTGNRYNLALSKNAGVDISAFVHNVSRSGYFYILDDQGNDLLATEKKNNAWVKRDKRLLISDVFTSIKVHNNPVSHRPELNFEVKNQDVIKAITDSKEKFYIYSDIGQLLDYIRSSIDGIRSLGKVINSLKDETIKNQLLALLDNNTPGLNKGSAVLALADSTDPRLVNLLNPNSNGQFGIDWTYSDKLNSNHKLSVDTNNPDNTYDPAKRFNPDAPTSNSSPINAWLPYIKDLVIIPDVSAILQQNVIDYRYVPYWVGNITLSGSNFVINDDTFNLEKTQQIESILTAGLTKNVFTLISYSTVNPILGAVALKIVIVVLVLATIILTTIILFYYRLLGIIVLIIISLFIIFTILTFTFINGIIGPESLIAFIIGFALLVDTIINLLERFKKEHLLQKKTLSNAFSSANKKTLSTAFDCSTIILIVALTIFWFGKQSIKGFIIMTSIATFNVIVFGIILLRIMLWAILKKNWLENKPPLLGTNISFKKHKNNTKKLATSKIATNANKIKPKQTTWREKFCANFSHKSTKLVLATSTFIILASGISYGVEGANFGSGFDKRTDFIGMTRVKDDPNLPSYDIISVANKAIDIIKPEIEQNSQYNKIFRSINFALNVGAIDPSDYQFDIIVATTINSQSVEQDKFKDFLRDVIENAKDLNEECTIEWSQVDAVVAKSGSQLLINMIIAIALSFIVILIYIIIRFQLTYVLPLILAIIFALIMTIALINLVQIVISTSIVGILLGVMILTIISVMAIFDNIREMKISNEKLEVITTAEIKEITHQSVKKVLARTLFINSIVLILAVVTIFIVPNFWMIALAMLVGSLISLISSYFIAPWLWTYFERWRIKRYRKRLTKIKKNFIGADEYVIKGINE